MASKTRNVVEIMKQKAANQLRAEWEKETRMIADEHAKNCMTRLCDVLVVEATWAVWTQLQPTKQQLMDYFKCLQELIEEHGLEGGLESEDWGIAAFQKQLEEEAGLIFQHTCDDGDQLECYIK